MAIELPFLEEEFRAPCDGNPPPSFFSETMETFGREKETTLRRVNTSENLNKGAKDREPNTQSKLKRISRSFRNGPEPRKSRHGFSLDDSASSPVSRSPTSSPSRSPNLSASEGPSLSASTSPALSAAARLSQPSKFKIDDDQFCCEDTPENIIFDEDGTIKAATVEKLVQRVTFEINPDPKLVEDFLLTYRSFISPERLMELLQDRFNTKCPPNLSPDEKKQFEGKFLMPVRLRVFNLCKNWVKFYNADFMDDPKLAKDFEKWIKGLFDKKKCEDLKNILKSARDQLEEGEEASTKKKKKNARETHKPKSLREGWKWLKKAVHIKTFDLSNQDLAFIPDEIAYLGKLTSLSIAHNGIDAIPRAIAYLDKLEVLKCEGNKIKEIPEAIAECKKIRSFNISSNKLTALPEFLAWLTDLKYFYCNDNEIKSIPSELLQKGGQELLQHLKICLKKED